MIFDRMEVLSKYLPHKHSTLITDFIEAIKQGIADGYYEISGESVYARVMSYETRDATFCQIETHRHFHDIQFSIDGAEGVDIFQIEDLKETGLYDVNKDVQLYEAIKKGPFASVKNRVGYFCMIPAGEPHRPMVRVPGITRVKKCVIKIDVSEEGL